MNQMNLIYHIRSNLIWTNEWMRHTSKSRELFEPNLFPYLMCRKCRLRVTRIGITIWWRATRMSAIHLLGEANECLIEKSVCESEPGPLQNYLYPSPCLWQDVCEMGRDHLLNRCRLTHTALQFHWIIQAQNDLKLPGRSSSFRLAALTENKLSLKFGRYRSRAASAYLCLLGRKCVYLTERGGGIYRTPVCSGHTLKCLLDMRPGRQSGLA